MVTPAKCLVIARTWLLGMYSDIDQEIVYLGNIILDIQRQDQNPHQLTSDISADFELALHYQWQIKKSDLAKLQDTHYKDYFQFNTASIYFPGEVQMRPQYPALYKELLAHEVRNKLLSQINMFTAVNAAQMQSIDRWITYS